MMSLTEEKITAPIYFKEHNDGKFILNIGEYDSAIILSTTDILITNANINTVNDVTKEHIQTVLSTDPEVVIIGTGTKQQIPPFAIMSELAKAGKNLDFMTSDMACKTYNVLVNENRNICCIII